MSEFQSIQISIADRYYPLKIAVQDEEKIRAAVKIINEKVDLYRKKYATRDIQDALSMALLQFVIRLISHIFIAARSLNRDHAIATVICSIDRRYRGCEIIHI